MRYVVDIDGTICVPGKTDEERYTGATPIQERIDTVNKLYDEGNTIVYLTARGMGRFDQDRDMAIETFYTFTKNQLDSWGCKYHRLFLGKPSADYYIDDKGINSDDFFGN
tara:strand:- start:168 stop:497 length:330 start_codon:yes stop_codon:yes gene_type:complete